MFVIRQFMLVIFGALAVCGSAHSAPPAAELQEQESIKEDVQKAWVRREFGLLDAYAEEWRTKATRTSSGYWLLSLLYNHLDERFLAQNCRHFPSGEGWVDIDAWIAAAPQSPTPVILKALMLVRQAQGCFVPPRTSRTTRPAPHSFNLDFLKAARELLEQSRGRSSRDPHWHTAFLRVLRMQGSSDDELLVSHAEAMAAHPLYYQTHFEMFRHFVLRWYPNMKVIDGFCNSVLAATKLLEGHQVYARLYEDATIELNQGVIFVPTRAVWARMRQGFEEIQSAYPTNWNAHHYAFNACMAQDGATTRRLFAAFKGPTVREAWQSSIIFKHCSALAN